MGQVHERIADKLRAFIEAQHLYFVGTAPADVGELLPAADIVSLHLPCTAETTDSIKETADAIHRDSNLVVGFLDECIEYDPMARLKASDFCLAHSAWWMELKGEDRRLPENGDGERC